MRSDGWTTWADMAYVCAIAFVAAVGGFLYGYDGGIIIGANLFLREQFQLSDVGWAFALICP